MHNYTSIIAQYCEGWVENSSEKILTTLSNHVKIVESHGPVYKGKEMVKKWISDWHQEGGKVLSWHISSYHESGNIVFFEWDFTYSWQGEDRFIAGASIVKIEEGKILYLREYRTTETLFQYQ